MLRSENTLCLRLLLGLGASPGHADGTLVRRRKGEGEEGEEEKVRKEKNSRREWNDITSGKHSPALGSPGREGGKHQLLRC